MVRTLWSVSITASADQQAAPVFTIPVTMYTKMKGELLCTTRCFKKCMFVTVQRRKEERVDDGEECVSDLIGGCA